MGEQASWLLSRMARASRWRCQTPRRRGKGQKRTTQHAAVVTARSDRPLPADPAECAGGLVARADPAGSAAHIGGESERHQQTGPAGSAAGEATHRRSGGADGRCRADAPADAPPHSGLDAGAGQYSRACIRVARRQRAVGGAPYRAPRRRTPAALLHAC